MPPSPWTVATGVVSSGCVAISCGHRLLRAPSSAPRTARSACIFNKPTRAGATYAQMAPDTFLARLCALVPPPGAHTVRYYGVLAGRTALPHHSSARRAPATQAARPVHSSRASRASRHHLLARVSAALRGTPSPLVDAAPRSRIPHRHLRLRPLCRTHAPHPGRHHSRANRRRAPWCSAAAAARASRTAPLVLPRLTSSRRRHRAGPRRAGLVRPRAAFDTLRRHPCARIRAVVEQAIRGTSEQAICGTCHESNVGVGVDLAAG